MLVTAVFISSKVRAVAAQIKNKDIDPENASLLVIYFVAIMKPKIHTLLGKGSKALPTFQLRLNKSSKIVAFSIYQQTF